MDKRPRGFEQDLFGNLGRSGGEENVFFYQQNALLRAVTIDVLVTR